MKTKVSVIIPVYDIPDGMLIDCVQSLLKQTLDDIEFIFVNDHSPNIQNKEYLQVVEKNDKRVKLIDLQENKGVSNARNVGLEIASGDYIGFTDADDLVVDIAYERMYLEAVRSAADIVMCNSKDEVSEGVFVDTTNVSFDMNISTEEDWLFVFRNMSGGNSNKLFKRETIASIRFNEKTGNYEDLLFNWNVYIHSHKMKSIDDVLKIHRYRATSASRKKLTLAKFDSIFLALMEMTRFAVGLHDKTSFQRVSLYLYYYVLTLGLLNRGLFISKETAELTLNSVAYKDYQTMILLFKGIHIPCYLKKLFRMYILKGGCANHSYLYYIVKALCLFELNNQLYNSRIKSVFYLLSLN